jgi:hypothetical protein
VSGSSGERWPGLNRGTWETSAGELDCKLCAVKRPLTKAEADQAVARSMGLFEAYECPSGLGWHLRVAKDEADG